jgi:epoxyqueuosine reductase
MLFNPEEQSVFKTNPALYIEKAIKEYVKFSPNNRLTLLGNDTIWDEPLVGFADGCDPLFKDYKTIIGDFYVTPARSSANVP